MADIPSNNFKRQWKECGSEVVAAVQAVGESGWYILGTEVRAFEERLARVFSLNHAIGCANGMDGLEMALRVLELPPGSKVLTTPLSAFATTLAIVRAGLIPVFVDVDEHGLLDLALCESALKSDPAIKCVLPVHLYGHCLNLERLATIKREFGVFVVEDCAQSILACYEGAPCGSVGELSATSFYPTKNLGAFGDGGAVLTNSELLAKRVRSLRDYGQSAKYVHDDLGLNSRLDEVHAAILNRVFLPRLGDWTSRRSQIATTYMKELRGGYISPLPTPNGSKSCWHLFPVLVNSGERAEFQDFLKSFGIASAIHYPCLIPSQRAMTASANYEIITSLQRAEEIASRVVSIPNHPYMTDDEVEYCVATINKWKPK